MDEVDEDLDLHATRGGEGPGCLDLVAVPVDEGDPGRSCCGSRRSASANASAMTSAAGLPTDANSVFPCALFSSDFRCHKDWETVAYPCTHRAAARATHRREPRKPPACANTPHAPSDTPICRDTRGNIRNTQIYTGIRYPLKPHPAQYHLKMEQAFPRMSDTIREQPLEGIY